MCADALLGVGTAALVVGVFYGPWQAICTDWARQIIFESRDELFDMARSGQLDFNSNEYRTIRKSLEGLIRYAHDLTIIRVAMHGPTFRAHSTSNLRDAISKMSDVNTRKKVEALSDRAHKAILLMLGFKSILGLVTILIALLVKPIRRLVISETRTYADGIQREAEIGAC
jgi:hypothetical protein